MLRDPLTYRVASLPEYGTVYQYTSEGPGNAVLAPDTLVTDPEGWLIFMPAPDEYGLAYATVGVVASDGSCNSLPGVVTIHVLPSPVLSADAIIVQFDGSRGITFEGLVGASYGVYASTNLTSWSRLGTASESGAGVFLYRDATAASRPERFYWIRSP